MDTLATIYLMCDEAESATRAAELGLEMLALLPLNPEERELEAKLHVIAYGDSTACECSEDAGAGKGSGRVPHGSAPHSPERPRAPEEPESKSSGTRQRSGVGIGTVASKSVARPAPQNMWAPRDLRTVLQAVGVALRQVLAVGGIILCLGGHVSWRTGVFSVLLWLVSGLGVTAGAHRLWTHASYRPTLVMEFALLLMYSVADQGPIRGWSLTHAVHHRSSDTADDPHNRSAGFWHAHIGWIFSAGGLRICQEDYHRIVKGHSFLVSFHDACCLWWGPLWSLAMPAAVASCWGEALPGFLVAGALRWAFVQHVTFFVNSVAHGDRDHDDTYSFDGATGVGPRVSLLVTLLALGEGWHDYHHLFPWDYAAAELDAWDQWNPTKVFIDACAALGMCSGRRRCSTSMQVWRRSQFLAGKEKDADFDFTVVGMPFLRRRVAVSAS